MLSAEATALQSVLCIMDERISTQRGDSAAALEALCSVGRWPAELPSKLVVAILARSGQRGRRAAAATCVRFRDCVLQGEAEDAWPEDRHRCSDAAKLRRAVQAYNPDGDHQPRPIKLLLVGGSAAGKSSMMLRYTDDRFEDTFIATIGIDYKVKTIAIEGVAVRLQIWDTAGAERFRTITSAYYRGAHGAMMVFDIGDRDSFETITQQQHGMFARLSKCVDQVVLVGNKTDRADGRLVSEEEARSWASSRGMPYFEHRHGRGSASKGRSRTSSSSASSTPTCRPASSSCETGSAAPSASFSTPSRTSHRTVKGSRRPSSSRPSCTMCTAMGRWIKILPAPRPIQRLGPTPVG